jgi:Flp pilus assembly pilin Flp
MSLIVRTLERLRTANGQTMTEYALILATIAAVLLSLLNTSGILVKTLVNNVDSLL